MLSDLAAPPWILCPTTGKHHPETETQHPLGSALGCSGIVLVPVLLYLASSQLSEDHLLSFPRNPQPHIFLSSPNGTFVVVAKVVAVVVVVG